MVSKKKPKKKITKKKVTKKEATDKCPWCKTLPTYVELLGFPKMLHYYACEGEKCPISPTTPLMDTKIQARNAWNRKK